MKKSLLTITLPISIFRAGKTFVAHSPVLDLSSCGKTRIEAEQRFNEAARIFFDELMERGTLANVLSSLGWKKAYKKHWKPPTLVANTTKTLTVPT